MHFSARLLPCLFIVSASAQQVFSPAVRAAVGFPSQVLYGSAIKSSDAGRTWTPLYLTESGLQQPIFKEVEIDPVNSALLYVITSAADGTFWKSTDAGATWRKSTSGLPPSTTPDALRQTATPHALYIKAGTRIYKSADNGDSWTLQSNLPGSDPAWEMSLSTPTRMYAADREAGELDSLYVYSSSDEGRTWIPRGTPSTGLTISRTVSALGVSYSNPDVIYMGVSGCCEILPDGGAGVYVSSNGGQSYGINKKVSVFTRIFVGPGPQIYAPALVVGGYSSSPDDGVTWISGFTFPGLGLTNFSAVDPNQRNVAYGSSQTGGLVRSLDTGVTWSSVGATITPTLAKIPIIQIELEEGQSSTRQFITQILENNTWVIPVTLSSPSADTWLSIGSKTGNTPYSTLLDIRATSLATGVYTSSITVTSPQAGNKSITVPIQLTVRPRGSLATQFRISTVMGNGQASTDPPVGNGTDVPLGTVGSLAINKENQLLAGFFNRLLLLKGTTLSVLAGQGVSASTGDGGPATAAQIATPSAIAVSPQGDIFLSESTFSKVRRIRGGTIESYLDKTKVPAFNGSSLLALDSAGRLILANSTVFSRYDGQQLTSLSASTFIFPRGLAITSNGDYLIADANLDQIRRVPAAGGPATVFAGTGTAGVSGDGGLAMQAQINNPIGLAFDAQGTLYFSDSGNNRIRAIGADGVIRTVAGTGSAGFAGDGGSAQSAMLSRPEPLVIDKDGNIYFADAGNLRVRKLEPLGPHPQAILHGASGSPKLSPGSLFSIYGTQLSESTRISGETPWPRSMDGVVVTVNGVTAPLYYVSPTQINGQIPYETAIGTANVLVTYNGSVPAQLSFPVVVANPGVLVYNGDHAVAVNPSGAVNAAGVGAKPGEIELLYFSGIGVPNTPVATGAGSPSADPLGRSQYPSSIKVNGQTVEVFYLGLAPGYPALCQANFKIPSLPPGDYSLTVTVNGEESNVTKLTIAAP
ncbi:MAG: hypothetical protein ABIR70_17935 [Bryobacteraceae bacterium]